MDGNAGPEYELVLGSLMWLARPCLQVASPVLPPCLPGKMPAKERSVPLARYFTFVGGALLALLLGADWYWQNPPPMPSYGSPIDKTVLRIRSEHKWPQKVVLDTTTPIIVPPSPSAMAETAIPSVRGPATNALALANPAPTPTAKRKSSTRARVRYPDRGGPVRFAVNPMRPAWPAGW